MKKFLKIFFSFILVLILLGLIFYMVDSVRVHSGEEPTFSFSQKLVDGLNYSAKVDYGLGYKIIRFDMSGHDEIIKIGTIFMDENFSECEYNIETNSSEDISGESGEVVENVKITTFGEKYQDTIILEGYEQEVSAKDINSKVGYSMMYYYDLFEYSGFDDHDLYLWHLSSGDDKSTLTIYDVSNEEVYKEALDNIEKEKIFDEISGDNGKNIKKLYYRAFEQDEVKMINYIYLMDLDNLKLMVDLYLKEEAEEGIGNYMRRMLQTISGNK